jgi:hypothetical protein
MKSDDTGGRSRIYSSRTDRGAGVGGGSEVFLDVAISEGLIQSYVVWFIEVVPARLCRKCEDFGIDNFASSALLCC